MKHRTRYIVAASLSLLAHLRIFTWGMWGLDINVDVPDISIEFETVELIDPNLLQAEAPAEPVEPMPPVGPVLPENFDPNAADSEDTPPEEEKKEKPQKKQFGDSKSKVNRLGPKNSTFFALLANKRIAKLPFAESAADIMAPMPDFEFIIQGGNFHPWHDFDYIVIASSDIRDMTQTFLAVQSKLPRNELKAGLERAARKTGDTLEWVMRDGMEMANPRPIDETKVDRDPRWFVFLEDEIAIYVRDEFLDNILRGPDKSKGKTSGNFVANIAKLRRFTRQEPRAGLQLVFSDMRAALKNVSGLPFEFPDDLEIFAEASKKPEIVIKLGFQNAKEAKQALNFWENDLKRLINGKLALRYMVGSYYDSTTTELDGKRVILRNRFNEQQAKMILDLLADFARKQMRRSKDQVEQSRKDREAAWEARKNGKLLPSEVEAQKQVQQRNPPPGRSNASPQNRQPSPSSPIQVPTPIPSPN